MCALGELDLRAVVLDYSESAFGTTIYEPGYVPVAQLNFLTGRAMPAATGPTADHKLRSPDDTLANCPRQEQAGIHLLIDALDRCETPAFITVTGSCRPLAAAINREPQLFQDNTRAIVLNAGRADQNNPDMDYNTKLDPHAIRRVLTSGLPLWWFPVAGNAGYHNCYAPNNTHFISPYKTLLADLDERLLNWFVHGLWGNLRGDIIRAVYEANRYEIFNERMNQGQRNLFCTASFAMMAGRELVLSPDGWRFVPRGRAPADQRRKPMQLLPIDLTVNEDGSTAWTPGDTDSPVHIFQREPGEEEHEAMGQALNHLLRQIPI